MTDRELAAAWDADHRLAAIATLVAGAVAVIGTALVFSVGTVPIEALVEGRAVGSFPVTLVAGLLLAVDIALLVFVVGLAHTFARTGSFGLTATIAVATLATTAAATVHLVWAHVVSSPETDVAAGVTQFATWLAVNLWILPLFGLLVGATLLALALALLHSASTFARRLGAASAVVGGALCVLAPFSGFDPDQPALAAVAAVLVATAGISALLLVTLVRLGLLLARTRSAHSG